MGEINQLLFAKHVFRGFKGSILEVGSKDYGSTQPFRELFPESEYVGVDMSAGKNVDIVVDLERGLGQLQGHKFDLVIVCSVLEHTPRPWILADNLCEVLADDGVVYSCHPWVWRYHRYPDDYFRFSPRGIQSLFSKLCYWLPMLYCSNVAGEFFSFSDDEEIDNKLALINENRRKYLPYLQTVMVGTKSESRQKVLYDNFRNGLKS